jgi:Acidic N-terminal SPT6
VQHCISSGMLRNLTHVCPVPAIATAVDEAEEDGGGGSSDGGSGSEGGQRRRARRARKRRRHMALDEEDYELLEENQVQVRPCWLLLLLLLHAAWLWDMQL